MHIAATRRIARIALLATLVACAVAAAAPAGASAFSKAIWGPVTWNGVNQFPMYQKLGVKIYEEDLNWNDVAPTRPRHPGNPSDPAYHWPAVIAQTISLAASYHMQVLLQLINAPAWADGGHRGDGWTPRNPGAFALFAQAAAREYPSVRLWMVWGEPTKIGQFKPEQAVLPGRRLSQAQAAAPHLYAEMLDDAYGTLTGVNSGNLVIGGNTFTTGQIDTLQWLQNLRLPDGRPPRMDMWGQNPFSYTAPTLSGPPSPFGEVQFDDLPRLEGWIRRYLHRTLPLFLSEFTIPTRPDDTFNFWVEPSLAATWIKDALQSSRHWKQIYALGWVNVYDDLPQIAGGLLTRNGTPKPGFYAFEDN